MTVPITGKLFSKYGSVERKRFHDRLNVAGDKRQPFEKDRARIIHSAAFRRLQGKTQVFGMGGSDFFRTRLTHSIEAAQIGKGVAIQCGNANFELVEAVCLAHDIGHPPFGHTGEEALKECMKDTGGFEANAQNLRIISQLEIRTAKKIQHGLNLTRAMIDALLKYKTPYSEIDTTTPIEKWKFYYDEDQPLVEWATEGQPEGIDHSFECEIMNWADDIAYSTHDLEDGIKVGMISKSKITDRIKQNVKDKIVNEKELTWNEEIWKDIVKKIHDASKPISNYEKQKGNRRDIISNLIHTFIIASKAKRRTKRNIPSRYQFTLVIEPKIELKCEILKLLVWELIINDANVATLERKATKIVKTLFEEYTKFDEQDRTREMYPLDFREKLDATDVTDEKLRIACDYIAGMTDNYATRIHARLSGGDAGNLMDII